jgi:acetyl-CoA carboxylase beta subunit
MGGGEAGAGPCERCGEVGPVRKIGGLMYLCPKCRSIYETEALRRHAPVEDKGPLKSKSEGSSTT